MLIADRNFSGKCKVWCNADPVQIGSKWRGKPEQFIDTQNGVYWEVMPTLSDGERKVQRALLNKYIKLGEIVPLFNAMHACEDAKDWCKPMKIESPFLGHLDEFVYYTKQDDKK